MLNPGKNVTLLLDNRDCGLSFHNSVLRAHHVFSAGSPGRSEGMEERRYILLISDPLLSVPNAQRPFHCGALSLPATSIPSQDTSVPQKTEWVHCTWKSMISH